MKLFVGSLPFDISDEKLKELFEPFGTVEEAKVITDRETRRSRGFGFVTMSNADEAREAIKQMNGSNVGNRTIVVNEAREKTEQSRRR